MKKINMKKYIQNSDIKKIIELFNKLLEESDYNLNQFVKGDTITLDNKISDEFIANLKKFIAIIPEIEKYEIENEEFWNQFKQLEDYSQNDRFIELIKRYFEARIRPTKETKFIRELDFEDFKQKSKYCFDNFILQNIGKRNLNKDIIDESELIILRKAMLTFCEMVIMDNLSKNYAFDNIQKLFGLESDYCNVWWEYIKENEEKMWRILTTKHYSDLDNKIQYLIDLIEEKNNEVKPW